MGTGAALCLIGILPLLKNGLKIKHFFLIFAAALLLAAALIVSAVRADGLVYLSDGVYEKLFIYDREYNGRPVRFFQQDRSSSGAMYLDSEELVFDYTKYYALYQVFKPEIKQALVIGGGAYSVPRALLKDPEIETVDVVEIEPSLFELAKKYFRLPEDGRLKNQVSDGRRWLLENDKKYDLIFSDVYYSLYSLPLHFTTVEFFRLAKSRLSAGGVFMANLIGKLDGRPPSLIFSEIKTFKEAFPNSYFFAVKSPALKQTQNIIFVGWNSSEAPDFANRPERGKLIDLSSVDFSLYAELTDNYAPVEYLTGKVLD